MGTSIKKMPQSDWLWVSLWDIFLTDVERGMGQWHPLVGGPRPYKKANQASHREQASEQHPPAPAAVTDCAEINLFLPKVLLVMVF